MRPVSPSLASQMQLERSFCRKIPDKKARLFHQKWPGLSNKPEDNALPLPPELRGYPMSNFCQRQSKHVCLFLMEPCIFSVLSQPWGQAAHPFHTSLRTHVIWHQGNHSHHQPNQEGPLGSPRAWQSRRNWGRASLTWKFSPTSGPEENMNCLHAHLISHHLALAVAHHPGQNHQLELETPQLTRHGALSSGN